MSPEDDALLLDAARAVAAGVPVDWQHVESGAAHGAALGELLRELKVVEGIAEVHRTVATSVSPEASASGAHVVADADRHHAPTWGSLRLLEHVGRGAFGDVYRAWDPQLAREVALKLLRRRESAGDGVGALVIEEGRLLARVRHPNVVSVYGANRVDGRVGLWMEFIHGRTLEAVLRENGLLNPAEVARIGIDLCGALAAVHAAGTLHLDLKAQNVMQEPTGRIVLMDFGAGREHINVAPGELSGTPLYIAPEVLVGSLATARSDVYSVGVLLHHLLTGSYPVVGATLQAIREAHAAPRPTLHATHPELPELLCAAIEKALAADPEKRFASANALQQALMPPAPPATAAPARVALPLRGYKDGWFLVAFAVVVALLCLLPIRMASSVAQPRTRQQSSLGTADAMRPLPFWMPGDTTFASLSRDGRTIVYSDAKDGNLYLGDGAARTIQQLISDGVVRAGPRQAAEGVAIAPDGDSIAFTWQALDGAYELRTLTIANRVARPILRDSEITYLVPHAWTRDSTSILITAYLRDGRQHLLLVSALDGRRALVQEFGAREHPRRVSLSPDDRFIVYDGPGAGESRTRDIFIARTDGTAPRRLIAHPANDGNATWTPDGKFVLFTSDRAGTMDLWRVAVSEGNVSYAPERTYRDIGKILPVGITNEGQLVYHQISGAYEVYQANIAGSDAARPSTLTSNYYGQNISSLWSADGRRVAFTSRRGLLAMTPHSTALVVRDLESGKETELDPPMNQFLVRAWSPDGGRLLIVGQGSDGIQGARTFNLESGVTALVARGGAFARPDWLSNGRIVWLERSTKRIISRDLQTDEDAVLFDLTAHPGDLIADVLGRGFRVSPDGQSVAFTSLVEEGGKPLYRLEVLRDGVTRVICRDAEPLRLQDWLPDASAILFTRWTGSSANGPIALWRVDADGSREQPLRLSAVGLRDVSVSPDGSRITFTAGWPSTESLALDVGRSR